MALPIPRMCFTRLGPWCECNVAMSSRNMFWIHAVRGVSRPLGMHA